MSLYFRFLLLMLRTRRARRISIWDTSRTTFRVLPNDLDLLGHMNNGRYLTLMDLARMDLMLRSGMWKRLTERDWYPVVAGQSISYRRSLNPGMRFEIHTRIIGLDEHGSYLEQTFVHRGDVYAQAIVRARFLKKSGGRVSDEELLALIGELPEHLTLPEWVSRWGAENRNVPKTI